MRKLKLVRIAFIPDGTFGILFDYDDSIICLTLEREWRNNEKNISCIPRGKYVCKRIQSSKFGDTFEVFNVSGRSHILFHKGNIEDDTHGCIITGKKIRMLKNKVAVLLSRIAFKRFMTVLNSDDFFELEITNGIR